MSDEHELIIDHDGDSYLIYESYPKDNRLPAKAKTKAEVDYVVHNWSIIEYSTSWTEAANLALAHELMTEPPKEIFLAIWSGGLEEPNFAAFGSKQEAIAKIAEAWLPDFKEDEGDRIDIIHIDPTSLKIEDVTIPPAEIAAIAHEFISPEWF